MCAATQTSWVGRAALGRARKRAGGSLPARPRLDAHGHGEGPCRVVALALSTSRAWQGHRCSRPAHGAAPQVSGSPRSARGGSIDSAAAAASVACAAPPDRPWAPSATRRYSRAVHCGLASWVERVPCRLGMYRSRSGPFVPRAHGLWSHMSESARPRVWHGATGSGCSRMLAARCERPDIELYSRRCLVGRGSPVQLSLPTRRKPAMNERLTVP